MYDYLNQDAFKNEFMKIILPDEQKELTETFNLSIGEVSDLYCDIINSGAKFINENGNGLYAEVQMYTLLQKIYDNLNVKCSFEKFMNTFYSINNWAYRMCKDSDSNG